MYNNLFKAVGLNHVICLLFIFFFFFYYQSNKNIIFLNKKKRLTFFLDLPCPIKISSLFCCNFKILLFSIKAFCSSIIRRGLTLLFTHPKPILGVFFLVLRIMYTMICQNIFSFKGIFFYL